MKNVLIVDSGSTKSDWVIFGNGQRRSLSSVAINPFYQNESDIRQILEREILTEWDHIIDELYFFGAGCADEQSSKPVYDALAACFPDTENIEVASDMLGTARGLCGHTPGIACILGTGANNAVYDGERITNAIGSLGFWLGDEGSGGYLGKALVVKYLSKDMPNDLSRKFAIAYPDVNRLSVLERAYKQPFPNRYFATYAKFIHENIAHTFVLEMVNEAFRDFVSKYVMRHSESEAFPIHFTGSIAFYFQDILKQVLAEQNLILGSIKRSPLDGLITYYSSR